MHGTNALTTEISKEKQVFSDSFPSVCVPSLASAPRKPTELYYMPTLFSKDKWGNYSWLMMHFALSWEHTNWIITFFLFQCFPHRRWSHLPSLLETWHECIRLCREPPLSCVLSLVHLLRAPYHTSDKTGGKREKKNTLIPHHKDIRFSKETEDSDDSTVDVDNKQKPRVLPKKDLSENKPRTKTEK